MLFIFIQNIFTIEDSMLDKEVVVSSKIDDSLQIGLKYGTVLIAPKLDQTTATFKNKDRKGKVDFYIDNKHLCMNDKKQLVQCNDDDKFHVEKSDGYYRIYKRKGIFQSKYCLTSTSLTFEECVKSDNKQYFNIFSKNDPTGNKAEDTKEFLDNIESREEELKKKEDDAKQKELDNQRIQEEMKQKAKEKEDKEKDIENQKRAEKQADKQGDKKITMDCKVTDPSNPSVQQQLNGPAGQQNCPAGQPNAPAAPPNAPVAPPNAPAAQQNAPAAPPNAPAVQQNAPAEQSNCPATQPNAPAGPPNAPAGHQNALLGQQNAPAAQPSSSETQAKINKCLQECHYRNSLILKAQMSNVNPTSSTQNCTSTC